MQNYPAYKEFKMNSKKEGLKQGETVCEGGLENSIV